MNYVNSRLILLLVVISTMGSFNAVAQTQPAAARTHTVTTPSSSTPLADLKEVNSLQLKVESIPPLLINSLSNSHWWSFWIPVIGPVISGVLAFIGVFFGLRVGERNSTKTIVAAQKSNEAAIWQKANEVELKDIQAKLDGFYIPFQLLSMANYQFAQDIRSREEPEYRMLLSLFDENWRRGLSSGEKSLVEIVCANGEELRALIASKSGLVDDKILPYLSRVSVHFKVLHLAYKGRLGDDSARFEKYIYPRELDRVLALEIVRLKNRMALLRANPGVKVGQLEPLKIPPEDELPGWVEG